MLVLSSNKMSSAQKEVEMRRVPMVASRDYQWLKQRVECLRTLRNHHVPFNEHSWDAWLTEAEDDLTVLFFRQRWDFDIKGYLRDARDPRRPIPIRTLAARTVVSMLAARDRPAGSIGTSDIELRELLELSTD